MIRHNQTRGGMTLIELLVVLGIITLLAALLMSGVGAVRERQMVNSTANNVNKLQDAIDTQVKALVDQAAKDRAAKTTAFVNLTAYCGADEDRAQALLVYLKLRHAFPQTHFEATNNVVLAGAGITWPPHKAYASVLSAPISAIQSWPQEEQSAALLYLGLSKIGTGGSAFASDDGTSGNQDTNWRESGVTVYTDAWKRPIGFKRFLQTTELDTDAKYANQKDWLAGRSIDPFDPQGKLYGWNPATPAFKTDAQTAVGALFDRRNKVISAYSWGPNKVAENFDLNATDDIIGYRLRQLGSNATGKGKQ